MKSSEDKKHQELQQHDHGESEEVELQEHDRGESEEEEAEDQPHPLPILTDSKPKFQPFKLKKKSLKIAKGFEFEEKKALIGPVLDKFETRFSPIKETFVYTKRLAGNPPFGFEQEEALVAEEEETRNVLQPVGARTEHKYSEPSVRARLGSQFERGTASRSVYDDNLTLSLSLSQGHAPGRSARIREKLKLASGDVKHNKYSEQSVRACPGSQFERGTRPGSQFERGTGDTPGRSARICEKLKVTAGDLKAEADNNNFDRAVEAVSEALRLDPESLALHSALREAGDARAKSSKLNQGRKEDGPTKR